MDGKPENMTEISDKLTRIEQDLHELKGAVIGNSKFGNRGLVMRVEDLEKYKDDDKKFKNKLYGGMVVVGTMWTIVIEYIHRIWK